MRKVKKITVYPKSVKITSLNGGFAVEVDYEDGDHKRFQIKETDILNWVNVKVFISKFCKHQSDCLVFNKK